MADNSSALDALYDEVTSAEALDALFGQVTAPKPRLERLLAPGELYHLQTMSEKPSAFNRFMTGLGGGLTRAYAGGEQVLGGILGNEEMRRRGTERGREVGEVLAPLGTAGQVGAVVGETLPYAVPLPGGVPAKAAQYARKYTPTLANALIGRGVAPATLRSGLIGGGQGLMSYVPEGDDRLSYGLMGALGGATAGSVPALLATGGAVARNKLPDIRRPAAAPSDFPLTLSESTRSKTSVTDKALDALGLNRAFRERQMAAADAEAAKSMTQYMVNPADPAANKAYIDRAYGEVRNLAQQIAKTPEGSVGIPATRTASAASELLAEVPELAAIIQSDSLGKKLVTLAESTAPAPGYSGYRSTGTGTGMFGESLTTPAATASAPFTQRNLQTFEEMWNLRKALGEKLASASKSLDGPNYRRYRQLYKAVTDDMNEWSNGMVRLGHPDIAAKFRAANEAYVRHEVKYNIMKQAYNASLSEVGDRTAFSPKMFAKKLRGIIAKDTEKSLYGTFSDAEIKQMTGTMSLMNLLKQAEKTAYTAPSPQGRLARYAGGGSALALMEYAAHNKGVTPALATAGAGSLAYAAKFLTTDPVGQKLAMSAAKYEPNSPQMRKLLGKLQQHMAIQGGAGPRRASYEADRRRKQAAGDLVIQPKSDMEQALLTPEGLQ